MSSLYPAERYSKNYECVIMSEKGVMISAWKNTKGVLRPGSRAKKGDTLGSLQLSPSPLAGFKE